jgi:hypothetical protein
MSENFTFDKFMDDILLREAEAAAKKKKLEAESNTPQREYIKRYGENPYNRIKVTP